MRKIIFTLLAPLTVVAGLALSTAPANADNVDMRTKNCVTAAEANRLRVGMAPRDVRRVTHAAPWMSANDTLNGKPVNFEAYNDCNPHSGKVFAVAYKIDRYTGGRKMMMAKFIRL